MKFRNIIMAVIALVITASGCQKIDRADSNSTVKVKFTIADKPVLGDPGQTKAVKTAWAEGDSVMIIFKPAGATNWYGPMEDALYKFTTTYTSSVWSDITLTSQNITDLGESGTYLAIHHRGKVTAKAIPSEVGTAPNTYNGYQLDGYKGGEFMSHKGTYTSDGTTITLSTIDLQLYSSLFQFSVSKDITDGSSNPIFNNAYSTWFKNLKFRLSIKQNSSPEDLYRVVALKRGVLYLAPQTTNGFWLDNSTKSGFAEGVLNGEDVSYCFVFSKPEDATFTDLVFSITNGENAASFASINIDRNDHSIKIGKSYRLPLTGWTK